MIHLQNIFKYYDSKFQRSFVLKDIELRVEEGEFVSIMGPNGSGKSTLLNIIGLLDAPSEKKYFLYDSDILKLKEKSVVSIIVILWGLSFRHII